VSSKQRERSVCRGPDLSPCSHRLASSVPRDPVPIQILDKARIAASARRYRHFERIRHGLILFAQYPLTGWSASYLICSEADRAGMPTRQRRSRVCGLQQHTANGVSFLGRGYGFCFGGLSTSSLDCVAVKTAASTVPLSKGTLCIPRCAFLTDVSNTQTLRLRYSPLYLNLLQLKLASSSIVHGGVEAEWLHSTSLEHKSQFPCL
jgi:hypothetical protein